MAQQHKLGTTATTVKTVDGVTYVTYHETDVVEFDRDKITLNSNGWRTHTTKTRMNQASNRFGLGFTVFQRDYAWFVNFGGKIHDFKDGIILHTNGRG